MTKRTVNTGMVTYIDTDGVQRMGLAGEEVDVHPDNLSRFAALNGGVEVEAPSKPAPKKAPQKRAAPKRK